MTRNIKHTNPKWFNKESDKARISFKKSANAANRDPSDLMRSLRKLRKFVKISKMNIGGKK